MSSARFFIDYELRSAYPTMYDSHPRIVMRHEDILGVRVATVYLALNYDLHPWWPDIAAILAAKRRASRADGVDGSFVVYEIFSQEPHSQSIMLI